MAQPEQFKLENLWDAIKGDDPRAMIPIAAGLMNDHNQAQQEKGRPVIPEQVLSDALEVIAVYIDYFEVWERAHRGLDIREIDRMLLGPSIKLDVCNETWKQVLQHVGRPIITNCVGCMQQARILYGTYAATNDEPTRERLLETMWSLLSRRYDFVPWLVFMITSDTQAWSKCQVACLRIAQGGDLPEFKARFAE